MSDPNRKFQRELNAGAISLVLLSVLRAASEPLYGYEIVKLLQKRSPGNLPMNQGAIYPVLRSMERQGLLASETRPSDSGPPRRYYRLTDIGDEAWKSWTKAWRETTDFVQSLLEMHNDDKHSPRASKRSTRSRAKVSS